MAIKPDIIEAHSNLSMMYDELGRYPEAVESYKQVIRLKPDDAEANNNMGYALGKSKRWPEAAAAFQRAIQLKPDYAEAYSNLGWAYNNMGNFQSALQPLKKAVELKPALPEGHFNIGITYSRLAQNPATPQYWQQALAEFQQTIQLKPDWTPAAQNNLGFAYGNLGTGKKRLSRTTGRCV